MAICPSCGQSGELNEGCPACPGFVYATTQEGKTTCWSNVQQAWVDEWVQATADGLAASINRFAEFLKARDDRPHQTITPEQPDVFFPYAAQGLLEDLITELQSRV